MECIEICPYHSTFGVLSSNSLNSIQITYNLENGIYQGFLENKEILLRKISLSELNPTQYPGLIDIQSCQDYAILIQSIDSPMISGTLDILLYSLSIKTSISTKEVEVKELKSTQVFNSIVKKEYIGIYRNMRVYIDIFQGQLGKISKDFVERVTLSERVVDRNRQLIAIGKSTITNLAFLIYI